MGFNGSSSGASRIGGGAAAVAAVHGFPEPCHLDEWRRAHAALLAEEHIFAELVTRHAAGSVSLEQLEDGRRKLHALRALEDVVAHKAFGLLPAVPHG
jgi:hypothetical protein